jgi:hypothetical protein
MVYGPAIAGGVPIRRIALPTGKHFAVLFDDIKSASMIEYRYILATFANGSKEPCLFVTSEVNKMAELDDGGSHFLCGFIDDQHVNYGSSDDWADVDKFEQKALDIALRYLRQG